MGYSKSSAKFIALSIYNKNTEWSQIYDLMLHLKLLENQKQFKHTISRRREIIKIMDRIKETEVKNTVQRMSKRKSWFFEKISEIDKCLMNLIKGGKKKK
jgi:hypothetical protein